MARIPKEWMTFQLRHPLPLLMGRRQLAPAAIPPLRRPPRISHYDPPPAPPPPPAAAAAIITKGTMVQVTLMPIDEL